MSILPPKSASPGCSVRDALMQLMHEGYLVGTTRGFTCPRLPRRMSPTSSRSAACSSPGRRARRTDLDAAGLKTLAAALQEAKQRPPPRCRPLFQANRHSGLAGSALSRRSPSPTIARFADHVLVVRWKTLSHQPTQAVIVAGMRAIYEAFVRRNAVAAYDRMTHFIRRRGAFHEAEPTVATFQR